MKPFKLKVSWKIGQKKHSVSVSLRIGSSSAKDSKYDQKEAISKQLKYQYAQIPFSGNEFYKALQKEMDAMSGVSEVSKGHIDFKGLKDIVNPSGASDSLEVKKNPITLVTLNDIMKEVYEGPMKDYFSSYHDQINSLGYTWQKYNINTIPSNKIIPENPDWISKRLHEMGFLVGDDITPEEWEEAYRKLLSNEHN